MATQGDYINAGVSIRRPSTTRQQWMFVLPRCKDVPEIEMTKGIHYFESFTDLKAKYPTCEEAQVANPNVFLESPKANVGQSRRRTKVCYSCLDGDCKRCNKATVDANTAVESKTGTEKSVTAANKDATAISTDGKERKRCSYILCPGYIGLDEHDCDTCSGTVHHLCAIQQGVPDGKYRCCFDNAKDEKNAHDDLLRKFGGWIPETECKKGTHDSLGKPQKKKELLTL